MLSKSFGIVVMAILVVAGAAQPASAGYNALVNGSFETAAKDPGGGVVQVSAGDIDSWFIEPTLYLVGTFWQASQGNRSLDLNSTGPGSIRQKFGSVGFGNLYLLSLDLAGNPDIGPGIKSLRVRADLTLSQQSQFHDFTFDTTGKSKTNMGWTTKYWSFYAPGSQTVLSFISTTNGSGGPALDNVVVTPVSTLITNGSFEVSAVSALPPPTFVTLGNGSGAIGGWTVGGIGIDYVGGLWQASQGLGSIDLNSTGPGSMQQSFPTTPGELYQVLFDLAGNPLQEPVIKSLRVSAGNQSQDFNFDTTGMSTTNMGWVRKQWTFRANASTTTLIFQSLNSGTGGPVLDNVQVMPINNLVLNGSFETGSDPGEFLMLSYGNSSTIAGWTVAGNGIDYYGSGWQASDGGRSLDMNAVDAGSIEQTFLTTPGATYHVTFDLAGNPSQIFAGIKTLQVSAAGKSQIYNFDTTGKSATNMGWTRQTFTFTATWEATTLLFESLTSGAAGPALDNVRVTPVGTVPYLLLLLD